jgi:hypothetical protein
MVCSLPFFEAHETHDRQGTLEMNNHDAEEEHSPPPRGYPYGHDQRHNRQPEPPRGYPSQGSRPYDHDRPPSSTSDHRRAPEPLPNPLQRSQTEPPLQWGSKNPYLNVGQQPPSPPSPFSPHRGAPINHRAHPQPRYEQDDDRHRRGSPFEGSQGYPPRQPRQPGYGNAPPRSPAPHYPSQRPGMDGHVFSDPNLYHGNHHGRSRSREEYTRSPSPGSESSDREDRFQEENRRSRRMPMPDQRGTMPPAFNRAMDEVDRVTGKMSRMRF